MAKSTRPPRPRRPSRPDVFTTEAVTVYDETWGHHRPIGSPDGPLTLAEIITLIPDDVSLDEVIVTAINERSDDEFGTHVRTRIYFGRVRLAADVDAKLAKYRADMERWTEAMADYKPKLLSWVKAESERKELAAIVDKRKELERINREADKLNAELRDAEKAAKRDRA